MTPEQQKKLIGGAADTFLVSAGAVAVVGPRTAGEVRTLPSVLATAQIEAAYPPLGTYSTLVGGIIPATVRCPVLRSRRTG